MKELERLVRETRLPEEIVRERQHRVAAEVMSDSPYLRHAEFVVISEDDLGRLFRSYDAIFFDKQCRASLNGRRLDFALSKRMVTAGGKTTRITLSDGSERFEIAIAINLLFDGFKEGDREVTVNGVPCVNRLEALQRIFEHELVHLVEMLCWRDSNCAAPRFQDIAARLFLHRTHTHCLVTREERAAQSNIHVGSKVSFEFEGRIHTGRVNRITQRATVLVNDPEGVRYSDGQRYRKYYVPLRDLTPCD